MTVNDLKKNWVEWDYDNFSNGIVLYADYDFKKQIGSVSIYEMIEFIQTQFKKIEEIKDWIALNHSSVGVDLSHISKDELMIELLRMVELGEHKIESNSKR